MRFEMSDQNICNVNGWRVRPWRIYLFAEITRDPKRKKMITREIKEIRCEDSLDILIKGGKCVFFTLTTPDEVDYHEIRERWRALRHALLRDLRKSGVKKVEYVMNYERHNPYLQKIVNKDTTEECIKHGDGHSHGWHIHGVINAFVDLCKYRKYLDKCGFGRVDVRYVNSLGVANYLTKHALKAYRGLGRKDKEKYKGLRVRLVNASRGLPALSEYCYKSEHINNIDNIFGKEKNEIQAFKVIDKYIDKKTDYRKIKLYCEVAALLNVDRIWKVKKTIERLKKNTLPCLSID